MRLESQHMEVRNKLEEWMNEHQYQQAGEKLKEAIKLYEEIRDSDSAVVELNIALIAQARIKWGEDDMSPEALQFWIKYVANALTRAEQLLATDEKRYAQEVRECLNNFKFELAK